MGARADKPAPTFDCRVTFAETLIELAQADERIVTVCNDSVGSSNLGGFQKLFPDRLINVGIAEQNMVGVSAGLANGGFITFCLRSGSLSDRTGPRTDQGGRRLQRLCCRALRNEPGYDLRRARPDASLDRGSELASRDRRARHRRARRPGADQRGRGRHGRPQRFSPDANARRNRIRAHGNSGVPVRPLRPQRQGHRGGCSRNQSSVDGRSSSAGDHLQRFACVRSSRPAVRMAGIMLSRLRQGAERRPNVRQTLSKVGRVWLSGALDPDLGRAASRSPVAGFMLQNGPASLGKGNAE